MELYNGRYYTYYIFFRILYARGHLQNVIHVLNDKRISFK